MSAASPGKNEETGQLSTLIDMLNATQLIMSYPEDVGSLSSLDDKLSSFPDTISVFFDDYLNALATNSKLSRQTNRPSVQSTTAEQVIMYDSVRRHLLLPAEFLLPPMYAADLFLSANYGILGTELSVALWNGVTAPVGDGKEGPYDAALRKHYANRVGCSLGSKNGDLDDVFAALAGEAVVEGFATFCREMSTVPSMADLKLLFLASCLPSCGSKDFRCNRATLCSVEFRQAFQC
ncbi:unnamed protein product, partial [Ixodes hexagonus]